jgi:hypothetical protein
VAGQAKRRAEPRARRAAPGRAGRGARASARRGRRCSAKCPQTRRPGSAKGPCARPRRARGRAGAVPRRTSPSALVVGPDPTHRERRRRAWAYLPGCRVRRVRAWAVCAPARPSSRAPASASSRRRARGASAPLPGPPAAPLARSAGRRALPARPEVVARAHAR